MTPARRTDEERAAAAEALRALEVRARSSLAIHNQLVLRHSKRPTEPIVNAPIHDMMCEIVERPISEETRRIVIMTSPECGKTEQITIGGMPWLIGRDPAGFRGFVGSATGKNAKRFVRKIRLVIESPRYQRIFPDVRPGHPWTDDEGFTIDRSVFLGGEVGAKEVTVDFAGADGDVNGFRYTRAFLDDILGWKNTRTQTQSDKVLDWIIGQLETRMDADGQIVMATNAWEPYDAAHRLVREFGWTLVRVPVRDPLTGASRWPEVWDAKRMSRVPKPKQKRVLDCIADGKTLNIVSPDAIERAMRLGRGMRPMPRWSGELEDGQYLVCGVDPNHKKTKKSNLSAFFIALVSPPRPGDEEGIPHKQVLWVEAEIMNGPEVRARCIEINQRFPGIRFVVEDVGAQVWLVDDLRLREAAIDVRAYTTGTVKHDPNLGVHAIALEFELGYWSVPCVEDDGGVLRCEDEVEAWLDELRYPTPNHTGDRVMASWLGCIVGPRIVFAYQADAVPLGVDAYYAAMEAEDAARFEAEIAAADPDRREAMRRDALVASFLRRQMDASMQSMGMPRARDHLAGLDDDALAVYNELYGDDD